MTVLDDILAALPPSFNLNPAPIPVLMVTYDGNACWVEISQNWLRTAIVGGSGQDLSIDLRGLSLSVLVETIAQSPGYGAGILDSFTAYREQAGLPESTFGAWCLLDGQQDVTANPILSLAGSVIYQILRPMANTLWIESQNVRSIVSNSQIDQASGVWLSDYGDLYGVDRNNGESDADYQKRLILQLIAPRTSNFAIRSIVRQLWGIYDASIDDDMQPATEADLEAMLAGHPWRRLNPYHFFATLQLNEFGGFTSDFASLRLLVNKIKAWGTSFDPRLLGVNEEINSRSISDANDTDYRRDTFIAEEQPVKRAVDIPLLTISDIWNDTVRKTFLDFILTMRSTQGAHYGHGQYGDGQFGSGVQLRTFGSEQNPTDDGNIGRGLLSQNPSDPRFLLLGPTRSMEPYTRTIVDSWVDVGLGDSYDDTVSPPIDQRGPDLLVSDEYNEPVTDELGDSEILTVNTEGLWPRLRYFKLNDIGSHLQSNYARMNATRTPVHGYGTLQFGGGHYGDGIGVSDIYDFVRDFVDGVPVHL